MLLKTPFIIAPEVFKLTQQLHALPELQDFCLVGGTSLALQLGHRNSIDIDLFSQKEFSTTFIIELLKQHFQLEVSLEKNNTLLTVINKIKVDFITHNYPYVLPPITEEGITFLSMEDIVALKLNAISHSGKRMKDFIDIYFLLERFSVKEMLDFFCIKYRFINPMIALKALNYFENIDEDIDPPKLLKPISMKEIKKRINDAILHSRKKF